MPQSFCSDKLRKSREQAGYPLWKAAQHVGLAVSDYYDMESDAYYTVKCNLYTLMELCDLFKVSPCDLFTRGHFPSKKEVPFWRRFKRLIWDCCNKEKITWSEFETRIGWEIRGSLNDPVSFFRECPVDCFDRMCVFVGCDFVYVMPLQWRLIREREVRDKTHVKWYSLMLTFFGKRSCNDLVIRKLTATTPYYARNLRIFRENKGVSREEMARQSGIDFENYCDLESSSDLIDLCRLSELMRVCTALQITPGELFSKDVTYPCCISYSFREWMMNIRKYCEKERLSEGAFEDRVGWGEVFKLCHDPEKVFDECTLSWLKDICLVIDCNWILSLPYLKTQQR